MTPTQLKKYVSATGSVFFSADSMRCFGDTMHNFSVIKTSIKIKGIDCPVFELRRKKPVKNWLSKSDFFCQRNFDRVFPDE